MPARDPARRRATAHRCYHGESDQSRKTIARTGRYRQRNLARLRAVLGEGAWCAALYRVAWAPSSVATLDATILQHLRLRCEDCAVRRERAVRRVLAPLDGDDG